MWPALVLNVWLVMSCNDELPVFNGVALAEGVLTRFQYCSCSVVCFRVVCFRVCIQFLLVLVLIYILPLTLIDIFFSPLCNLHITSWPPPRELNMSSIWHYIYIMHCPSQTNHKKYIKFMYRGARLKEALDSNLNHSIHNQHKTQFVGKESKFP